MNPKTTWGHTDRWLIEKVRGAGGWYISAPGSVVMEGWFFPTGAESLAAFAKGDLPAE